MALKIHNQDNRIQNEYSDKFNRADELRELESLNNLRENHPDAIAARNKLSSNDDGDIQGQEESPTLSGSWNNRVTGGKSSGEGQGFRQRARSLFSFTKKKGIIGGLAGGGIAATMFGFTFFGMYVGPIAAVANVTMDLSDPLSAVHEKTDTFLEKKLFRSPIATGNEGFSIGCSGITGKLPIKCRYGIATKKLTDKLSNAGIEVVSTKKYGPIEIPETFRMDGHLLTAEELRNYIRTNPSANVRYKQALNTNWVMMKGNTYVRNVLNKKFGVNQGKPNLEGDTVQEKANNLKRGNTGAEMPDIDTSKLVDARNADGSYIVDDEGNRLKSLETGKTLTGADGSTFRATDPNINLNPTDISNIETYGSIDPDVSSKKNSLPSMKPGAFSMARNSINILGGFDTGCTIKNNVRHASVVAKSKNAISLVKYAMPIITMVGALKAGDLTAEEAEVVQKIFYDTDAREFISGLIEDGDEYVFTEEMKNPDYGKNALDSDLFRMSEGMGVASQSMANKTYSQGFGFNSFLKSVTNTAGMTLSVLSSIPTPGDCGRNAMFAYRYGGLLLTGGIYAASLLFALPTGGASLSVSGGMLLRAGGQLALFTIAFMAIDNIANRYFADNIFDESTVESPLESGAAIWSGMAALNSEHSMQRGMMPANADQIVAYQQKQNIVRQEIIALERQSSNFFDINNQYSVTGSIALATQQSLPNNLSASTIASIPTGISSFINKGVSSLFSPNSAQAATLDRERYQQCDDEGYAELGISPDVQCNVRFVMPPESMQWDPIDTAQWMEDEGYVEENTTTGLPEGYSIPNPGESQSLVKNLISGAVSDYVNTRNYVNDYGKFLDFCVHRALPFGRTFEDLGALFEAEDDWVSGKKCLDISDEKINRFRAYVFDMSVNDDLDESPVEDIGSSTGGGGARISEAQLLALIKEYGLDPPTADGPDGWERLFKDLTSDEKSGWGAGALLAGEKTLLDRGREVKEYLNTAWIWFESGGGEKRLPDPYQTNCGDAPLDTEEGQRRRWAVSSFCGAGNGGTGYGSTLFQAAGFQVFDRENDIVEEFKNFYSDRELASVLENVLTNSVNAGNSWWDYNDSKNSGGLVADYLKYVSSGSVTVDDLSPKAGSIKSDSKAQFLTVMLGKDPTITTALNSYAVTDSDLIAALKTNCGYGYICAPEKQLLSNMIYALWKYDSQFGGPEGGTSSRGVEGIWGGGSMPLGQEWGVTNFSGTGYYDNYAGDLGVPGAHPGLDYSTPDKTKLYTPVSGKVVAAGGTCYFRDDRYTKNDSSCGNSTNLRSNPGTGEFKIEFTVDGKTHQLILGHMSKIEVSVGDTLSAGDYIGLSGFSNADHVHVEYRIPGNTTSGQQAVDPRKYLK